MSGTRRKWEATRDGPLAAEVAHVFVNGLACFKQASRRGALSQLSNIGERLYPDIPTDRNIEALLNKLLTDAIELLDLPQERHAAPESVGLKGTQGYAMKLEDRQGKAAQRYSESGEKTIGQNTYSRRPPYERQIIINIGRTIEYLAERGPIGAAEAHANPDYISRLALEAELREATRKSRLVVVVGEEGTGKSTLVEEFAKRAGPDRYWVLHAYDDRRPLIDLRAALGKDAETRDDTALINHARNLLADKRQAPLYVVIDNVEDWGLVDQLLPPSPMSTILVTARRELAKRKCVYVSVGSLSDIEAEDMVRQRIPDVSPEEVQGLTRLRGRALAIDQVCAFLRDKPHKERTEFLDLLKEHVAESLDLVAADVDERSLTRIYEEILKTLEASRETAPAVRLLEAIVHLQRGLLFPLDLSDTFSGERPDDSDLFMWAYVSESKDLGSSVCAVAHRVLQKYHLIEERYTGKFSYDTDRPLTYDAIHPLTYETLCHLFDLRLVEISKRVVRAAQTIIGGLDYAEQDQYRIKQGEWSSGVHWKDLHLRLTFSEVSWCAVHAVAAMADYTDDQLRAAADYHRELYEQIKGNPDFELQLDSFWKLPRSGELHKKVHPYPVPEELCMFPRFDYEAGHCRLPSDIKYDAYSRRWSYVREPPRYGFVPRFSAKKGTWYVEQVSIEEYFSLPDATEEQ